MNRMLVMIQQHKLALGGFVTEPQLGSVPTEMQQEIMKSYMLDDITTVLDLFDLTKNIEFTRSLDKTKTLEITAGKAVVRNRARGLPETVANVVEDVAGIY